MKDSQERLPSWGRAILLSVVFAASASGLVYELVAGAVSSYILGDAVTQFSLVIGVFLSAMGGGAFLAQFLQSCLLYRFVQLELWLGVLGGCSSMMMFAVSAFAESLFPLFFYSLCVMLGGFIGLEVPLLIRILQASQSVSATLSDVLALDYLGALIGSILFPFVVLPFLGLSRASVVFGLLNLAVAAACLPLLQKRSRGLLSFQLVFAALLLLSTFVFSTQWVGFFEDILYQDDIIYTASTPYQRIVLTRWRDDIRLYLNGHIQFSSIDEARYHESLVIPAMEASAPVRDVLILGGGDGMAAREVLKYDSVAAITVVDLDPAMTRLGQERTELLKLNQNSLNSPKVEVVNSDAMLFVEENRDFYDVIVIDLPDPNNEALSKLYSDSFYRLCARRLRENGVFVTQATSPFFARDAFWCIVTTVNAGAAEAFPESGVRAALPYHVNVPAFGEWGFVMGTKRPLDPAQLAVSVDTRFLDTMTLHAMFAFGKDIQAPENTLKINRLEHPVLYSYYEKGWRTYSE
ncbi:spermidine synthase [candidate division KSB3 bacterium]|uniref:Polyamine aminopropyltransferase n=1 Tax=candidate division KSB3 bacterium TaxID=2044937 RepID=A0A2G6E2H7_9BACT|nr:MAG: spermidine synthase [candidate division KSB3 bacterium]PIE28868.1 MAG: spermidine synthase [candidate division KSB3 bacterium]